MSTSAADAGASRPPPIPHPTASSSSSSNIKDKAVGSRGQALLPPVKRGSACRVCRTKKLKCDAQKPHCSQCIKHHALLLSTWEASDRSAPRPPNWPECVWDPEKAAPSAGAASSTGGGGGKRARTDGKGKRKAGSQEADGGAEGSQASSSATAAREERSRVAELEQKVHDMERLLGAAIGAGVALPPASANGEGVAFPVHTADQYPTVPTTAFPYDMSFSADPSRSSSSAPIQTSQTLHQTPVVNLANQPFLPHPPYPVRANDSNARGPIVSETQAEPYSPLFTPSAFLDIPSPMPTSGPSVTVPVPPASTSPPTASAAAPHLPPQSPPRPSSDILPSAYPPNLPPPSMLLILVETFFDRVPGVPKMLHRARFLRDLQRGPGDVAWPHPAVLHAICALTARYTGFLASFEPASTGFPPGGCEGKTAEARGFGLKDPLDGDSFGAKHAAWAREECTKEMAVAERLFDVAVARTILNYFDFLHARWVHCWMSAAETVRLCVPLGINDSPETVVIPGCKPGLLMPTEDAVERETRRRVFWAAFCADRLSSISSGWAQSLEEADVTVELPTSDVEFNRGTLMKENTQHLRSPNLFSSHYPETTDSYVLAIKAVVLLARVKQFNRRVLKESYANDAAAEHGRLKEGAQFRMVQNQVELFRTTLPKAFKQSVGSVGGAGEVIDTNLVFAHSLTFTAAIALHEHHVNLMAFADPSSAYVLAAARAQLSLLFQIFSTSFDVLGLPPFISHCWYIGGRTLARFYQAASHVGDQFAQKSIMAEIEIFRMALNLMGEKIPVAFRQAALLDQAVRDAINSTSPMKPAVICAHTMNEEDVLKEQQRLVSPVGGSIKPLKQQPFPEQARHSSMSSSTGSSSIAPPPTSASASGTSTFNNNPTISPYSAPGSAFSSASSPEEYLPRPPQAAPPLDDNPLGLMTPSYVLQPGTEFKGADGGLIESLFGSEGGMQGFDFGTVQLGEVGVVDEVLGEAPSTWQ